MRTTGWVLLAAAMLAAGCSKSSGKIEAYPVTGQVLYDGKPAAGVKVFLYPTAAPMVPDVPQNPSGVTGPDGRFVLTTFKDGDGAAAGVYQVILLWPSGNSEDEEGESDNDRFYGWFDVAHSKMTAEIKPGNNELKPIQVPILKGPPAASEGVPGRN